MKRRDTLLLGLSPLVLAACGFQPRQPVQMPFASLQYNGPSTQLGLELRRTLEANGVQLDPPPAPLAPGTPGRPTADVVLEVLADQRERVVVGQTAAGQVRELQLRHRFVFRLRTGTGRDLIGREELLQTRDISFTESVVLGKASEVALLYRDMQTDMVQQVMRRLASVKL